MLKGIKGALKVLESLDPESRERILSTISEKDPVLAEELTNRLVTLEDLRYLTVKMLVDLTREINLSDLGLALRASSDELKNFILSNVSSSMNDEINQVLKGSPQAVSKVFEAQEKILKILKIKMERGEIVLDKNSNDPFV
jgi:flagellar motor switch protein FliG